MYYIAALVPLLLLLFIGDRYFSFMKEATWGFFIWLLMHIIGGFLAIGGVVLYGVVLIPLVGDPYYIFRYDQLVHLFCYMVVVWFMYAMLLKLASPLKHRFLFSLVLFFSALSIGVLNEIIEFVAVVLFEKTGVGGYYNTILDLVFDLLGVLVGMAYLKLRRLL